MTFFCPTTRKSGFLLPIQSVPSPVRIIGRLFARIQSKNCCSFLDMSRANIFFIASRCTDGFFIGFLSDNILFLAALAMFALPCVVCFMGLPRVFFETRCATAGSFIGFCNFIRMLILFRPASVAPLLF